MNHAFAYVTYITFPPARLLVFPSMQSVGSIRYALSVSGDDVLYVSGGLSIFGVIDTSRLQADSFSGVFKHSTMC